MGKIFPGLHPSGLEKIIFISTLAAAVYWLVSRFIPVYKYPALGAIYELLWLPALLVLFILPIISFLLWAGQKFRLRSWNLINLSLALLIFLIGYLLE